MTKKKRYDTVLRIRLSKEMKKQLAKRADEENVSESDVVRRYLKDGLSGNWDICFMCKKKLKEAR